MRELTDVEELYLLWFDDRISWSSVRFADGLIWAITTNGGVRFPAPTPEAGLKALRAFDREAKRNWTKNCRRMVGGE